MPVPLFGNGRQQVPPGVAGRPAPQPAPAAQAQEAYYEDDMDADYDVPQASPRDIARFLVMLKPQVVRAIEVRTSWIKELGLLFAEASQGNAAQVDESGRAARPRPRDRLPRCALLGRAAAAAGGVSGDQQGGPWMDRLTGEGM